MSLPQVHHQISAPIKEDRLVSRHVRETMVLLRGLPTIITTLLLLSQPVLQCY